MTSVRFDSVRETWYHTRDTCYACQPERGQALGKELDNNSYFCKQKRGLPTLVFPCVCNQHHCSASNRHRASPEIDRNV